MMATGTDRTASTEEGPTTMFAMLKGLGLGAGMMYMLDPDRGAERRETIRDRIAETGHDLNEWFDEALNDPANHMPGLLAAAAGGLVGVLLLSRKPLTTLSLTALGVALAAQNRSSLSDRNRGPRHLPGDDSGPSAAERSGAFDPAEFAHYGAGGAGYSGGRQQSGTGPTA
jgi:hypothetical protein